MCHACGPQTLAKVMNMVSDAQRAQAAIPSDPNAARCGAALAPRRPYCPKRCGRGRGGAAARAAGSARRRPARPGAPWAPSTTLRRHAAAGVDPFPPSIPYACPQGAAAVGAAAGNVRPDAAAVGGGAPGGCSKFAVLSCLLCLCAWLGAGGEVWCVWRCEGVYVCRCVMGASRCACSPYRLRQKPPNQLHPQPHSSRRRLGRFENCVSDPPPQNPQAWRQRESALVQQVEALQQQLLQLMWQQQQQMLQQQQQQMLQQQQQAPPRAAPLPQAAPPATALPVATAGARRAALCPLRPLRSGPRPCAETPLSAPGEPS